MGNSNASQTRLRRNIVNYGSTRESNEDLTVNRTISNVGELNEFPVTRKRTLALVCLLVSQCFFQVAFSIISFWIPLSLSLNADFWVGSQNSDYYSYMHRVQTISVLALVLLCSTGLIAGIAMDTWFKKTKFVLVSLILACIGFGFLAATIINMSSNIHCNTLANTTGYSCKIYEFTLCLWNHPKDGYCLDVLIGWVFAVSILGSVSRTALPALGGDQIAERHGVKVFYAQFYWCQKAGEVISALICVCYLVIWNNFMHKDNVPESVERVTGDFIFLFIAWGVSIAVCCVISLLSFTIVVCGKLTREVNPDFGVLRDSLFMFVEACKRRTEKQEDDQWLDTAKQSRGGSFADQAVEERRQMAKFSLVLFLLTPVAFATTILTLPITPKNATGIISQNESFNQSLTTVTVNLARYVTACVAIPVIHIACNALVRRGRPVTLLHRFVLGHIFMVLALVVDMIVHPFITEYSVPSHIVQMILLGLCNAFIYTTGYELTLMSAPRAMQCTAMGLFYLVDGVANILCWIVIAQPKSTVPGSVTRTFITGFGGVAASCLSLIVLIVVEKKLRLGLDRV